MKRLTEQRDYPLTMSMWAGESKDLRIYNRLAEIENILGDDYDLDRLKELVDADRENKCIVLSFSEPECFLLKGDISEYGLQKIEWGGDTIWSITKKEYVQNFLFDTEDNNEN